jgi:hypothetical protein
VARTLATETLPPFHTLLPHGPCLDEDRGTILLTDPTLRRATLALGCAWAIRPRNCEVLDEAACLELARIHEGLFRGLPVGAALQTLLTIRPTTTAPAWETLRGERTADPLVQAQIAAFARGLPHRQGAVQRRLRTVDTLLTVRLPVPTLHPAIPALLKVALSLPDHRDQALVATLRAHLAPHLDVLAGHCLSLEDTLRAAGHGVTRLGGAAFGHALARALDVTSDHVPWITPTEALNRQVATREMDTVPGGLVLDPQGEALHGQLLALQQVPPQTYPGMLCAPRGPRPDSPPLALWEAWDGPMTLAVNVAVIDRATELTRLRQKRMFAYLQRKNPLGQHSPENAALMEQLDALLHEAATAQTQFLWSRIQVMLWGPAQSIARGIQEVQRRARSMHLGFGTEPTLGSTLALQMLPLGFDPAFPKDKWLQRARHIPATQLAQLVLLFGGVHGTETAVVPYVNQRGELVAFSPFNNRVNPHFIITGMTGAGKSFALIHLAQHVLSLGASMVILDRLPSYEDLCAVWGGHYIKFSYDQPLCFNPFYGPLDTAHQAFLKGYLAEAISGGVERLDREAVSVLADALAHFCQSWDLTRGEPRLGHFVAEVLADGCFAPQDPEAMRLGRELARKLSMFYGRGHLAGFVDGPNQLTIHPTLTVVELSGISDAEDLQALTLFSLMHLMKGHFQDPARLGTQKYFACDETAFALKHPATAEPLEEISRTYRKLNTSTIFLSQYATDFNTPVGKILRKGSPTTFYLQQEAEELDDMQEIWRLTPVERALGGQARRHKGWSSAFLRLAGGEGGLVHIVPDAFTYWMGTQEPVERTLREETRARYGGDLRAAVAWLAQHYPEGAL